MPETRVIDRTGTPFLRGVWLVAGLVAALLGTQVGVAAPAAAATPVTYQGAAYPTAGPAPTEDKPQSKLWYNDGAWWGLLRVSAGVTIHRLNDHVWRNTGTVVDERIASTGDALWANGKLYVGSRVSGGAMRAVRFSYNASTDTYSRDFSKQVAAGGTESMSIARDSKGRLWVAYTQRARVYVAHSTTSDTSWSAPFLVPVSDNSVASDDIAAIIAFNGKIGVMWSDQGNDVMRFAVHSDGATPTSGWTLEKALSGPNLADDHINLKSLTQDSQGRIFAAVKTSRGDDGEPSTDPLIVILQRSGTGAWSSAVAARVGDRLTRPQLALDSSNGRLYVVMANEGGGTVYYKSSAMSSLSFPTGKGAPFVRWSGADINDPSTAKHPVTTATGLVVLASDDEAKRYYHGELSLGSSPDGQPPTVPQGVTAQAGSSTSVTVAWQASTDDVGVTGYRVYRNGTQVGTPSGSPYTDGGLAAATTYSYTVAAVDAAGNTSAQSAPAQVTTASGTVQSAVTFVGAATATGTTSSTTVAAPPGSQSGDVLVAVVSARGAPTINTPSGWRSVRTDANGSTMRQAVFVRAATSTSNASTWTLSKAQPHVVQVVAYRGVDTSNPVVAAAGTTSTTATITSPAVAGVSGSRVLTFAGIARATTLSPASPLTERSEITTASTATYKLSADAADTTTSGTSAGPFTTGANGSAGGVGQTVSLRPRA